MNAIAPGLIEVRFVYGLGARFHARFDKQKIEGWRLRQVLKDAIDRPRRPGPADRAAKVLADILLEGREIDVEMHDGPSDATTAGTPITLDHVIVPPGSTTSGKQQSDTITVQFSESYVGGFPWTCNAR